MKIRHFGERIDKYNCVMCEKDSSKDRSCEFSGYLGDGVECVFKLISGICTETRVNSICK